MHLNEDKEINEIKQTELFNETALLYRLHKVYHHENEYRPRATSTGVKQYMLFIFSHSK